MTTEWRAVLAAWMREHQAFGIELVPRGPELEPEAGSREATVGAAASAAPVTGGLTTLSEIAAEIRACTRCPLHRGRTFAVPGEGPIGAPVFFVGEGPGESEDLEGRPFVGRSGELLTKMIEAMGFQRSEVFIANVVKCRPPDNRDPMPEEVQRCAPWLARQIALVQPKVIVTLGAHAARNVVGSAESVSRLRGRVHQREGVPVIATWHPAYLLRTPAAKREAWADLKLALQVLGRQPGPSS